MEAVRGVLCGRWRGCAAATLYQEIRRAGCEEEANARSCDPWYKTVYGAVERKGAHHCSLAFAEGVIDVKHILETLTQKSSGYDHAISLRHNRVCALPGGFAHLPLAWVRTLDLLFWIFVNDQRSDYVRRATNGHDTPSPAMLLSWSSLPRVGGLTHSSGPSCLLLLLLETASSLAVDIKYFFPSTANLSSWLGCGDGFCGV